MSTFLAAMMTPQLVEAIASLVGLGVTALIGFAIRHIVAMTWVAKDAKRVAVANRLGAIAENAVREVQQTYTDAIKDAPGNPDGRLTPEQQQIALSKALAIAKSNLGTAGLAEVKKVLTPDDVASLIVSHVEAAKHKVDAGVLKASTIGAMLETSSGTSGTIGAIEVAPAQASAEPVIQPAPPPGT